jgi:hypothetical protein
MQKMFPRTTRTPVQAATILQSADEPGQLNYFHVQFCNTTRIKSTCRCVLVFSNISRKCQRAVSLATSNIFPAWDSVAPCARKRGELCLTRRESESCLQFAKIKMRRFPRPLYQNDRAQGGAKNF